MANIGIGGARNINEYVAKKLKAFENTEKDFGALFDFMFSEEENIMFETSRGYRIEKSTYGEVKNSIIRRGAALDRALTGIERGSVIGIYLENSREWIEVFWSVLMCGYCPLLMNQRLDKHNLIKASRDACACAVIASDTDAAFLDFIRVVKLSEIEPAKDRCENRAFGGSIIVMSSGTSDRVKLAYYRAENFASMVNDSFDIIKDCPAIKKHYNGSLKQLAFLPFSHIFGLVAVYIWFAFFSRTFVLINGMDKKVLIDTIRRHEITHIFAVPLFWNTVYREALKTIRERGEKTEKRFIKGMRLSDKLTGVFGRLFRRIAFREVRKNLFGNSIRFMITGGSEIDGEVLRFFNGIGYRLANGYGMTEIGITSVELSSDIRRLNSGSVGVPFASSEYSIRDGCLFVRGRSSAACVREGERTLNEGVNWYRTGDLAEFKDGGYRILGRTDDVVIAANGENLNPLLIEDKFRIDGISECALVGLRGETGLKPCLVVALEALAGRDGAIKTLDEVRRIISTNGLDGLIARVAATRDSLLKEGEFKLNRSKIAKRLSLGEYKLFDDNAVNDDFDEQELIDRVRELFKNALDRDIDEIGADSDFFLDLGGSSLDFFGVVSELTREYGVAFPVENGKSISRPREIAKWIFEQTYAANGDKK